MKGENSKNDGKVCIICNEIKEHNIKRHYDTTHKDQFSYSVGKLREEKLKNMKYSLQSQEKKNYLQKLTKAVSQKQLPATKLPYQWNIPNPSMTAPFLRNGKGMSCETTSLHMIRS